MGIIMTCLDINNLVSLIPSGRIQRIDVMILKSPSLVHLIYSMSSFTSNPFIKENNLKWTLDDLDPSGPSTDINVEATSQEPYQTHDPIPGRLVTSLARNLSHFNMVLSSNPPSILPLLSIPSYASLFRSNINNPNGAHFVIHQHNHPIAGPHYDLRLQINPTSSVSWAVPYGLPGDPNSTKPLRMAIETTIHCLDNHLEEKGSYNQGSLLIWDTGTYEILPYTPPPPCSPHLRSPSPTLPPSDPRPEQIQLHESFTNRKIRLRLHGVKLPHVYTITLRLPGLQPHRGYRRPPSGPPTTQTRSRKRPKPHETPSPSPPPDISNEQTMPLLPSPHSQTTIHITPTVDRIRNEYEGASNTIGSVYQRKWFLRLDPENSGFIDIQTRFNTTKKTIWYRQNPDEHPDPNRLSFPFYVRGPFCETSVLTGRTSEQILADHSIADYRGRSGWKPIIS